MHVVMRVTDINGLHAIGARLFTLGHPLVHTLALLRSWAGRRLTARLPRRLLTASSPPPSQDAKGEI